MDLPQTHRVRYRVRFDEADASGNLRPSGMLRYTQDLAWQHSEVAGFDRHWYDARGTFWLVRMVRLRLLQPVPYGDHIVGTTQIVGWRRVWARRHTVFRLDDDTVAAEIDTDWVLLTTEGRPTRIPDEISKVFAPGSTYRPEKLEVPPTPSDAVSIEATVRAADVDPLGHLNNAAYFDFMGEAIAAVDGPNVKVGSEYRAEYLRPALPGTILDAAAWATDGAVACRMADEKGGELFKALVR